MIPDVLTDSQPVIAELCRRFRIRELSLFGSRARGDCGDASDFDFLVEFKPDSKIGFIELGRIQEALENVVKNRVDLVSKRGLKPAIRTQVLRDATVIYAE